MDPRLRHAVAVGKFRSFSKAADVIGVTQSAVTKSIADLERQIGFPLFQRTSRGAIPTEQGSVFLERAARLLADTAELFDSTRQVSRFEGNLRIGVFPAMLEWLLAAPVDLLLRRHPRIKLHIHAGATDKGMELLERGDIDLAIGFEAALTSQAQFKCEYITTLTGSAFVRQGHPLLGLSTLSDADIASHDMVLPLSIWHESATHRLAAIYGVERTDWLHRVENFSLACQIVKSTTAIGLVDSSFMQTDYFQAHFAPLSGFDLIPPLRICSAIRGQWEPKPSALAMIGALQDAHSNNRTHSDNESRISAHKV